MTFPGKVPSGLLCLVIKATVRPVHGSPHPGKHDRSLSSPHRSFPALGDCGRAAPLRVSSPQLSPTGAPSPAPCHLSPRTAPATASADSSASPAWASSFITSWCCFCTEDPTMDLFNLPFKANIHHVTGASQPKRGHAVCLPSPSVSAKTPAVNSERCLMPGGRLCETFRGTWFHGQTASGGKVERGPHTCEFT